MNPLCVKFKYPRMVSQLMACEQLRDAFICAVNRVDVSRPGAVEALGKLAAVDDELCRAIKALDQAAALLVELAEFHHGAPVAMNPKFIEGGQNGPLS